MRSHPGFPKSAILFVGMKRRVLEIYFAAEAAYSSARSLEGSHGLRTGVRIVVTHQAPNRA